MAAKQKHRNAGNSYNLCRKVEIPIEVQLNSDNAFFNEFASQPEVQNLGLILILNLILVLIWKSVLCCHRKVRILLANPLCMYKPEKF